MEEIDHTHLGYSDESYYHGGEYSSLCLITLSKKEAPLFEQDLIKILKDSSVREFKWKETGGAKGRFCAIKIIDLVHSYLKQKRIRIDTVIWNAKQRKDQIPEGNEVILGKMYFQLYKNVFNDRWPNTCIWKLHPDQQAIIDWNEMKNILDNVSSRIIVRPGKTLRDGIEIKKDFSVHSIDEVDSEKSPICQVADLFSGLAAFYALECPILTLHRDQENLSKEKVSLSNSQSERIKIIRHLRQRFQNSSMEIYFDDVKGIHTKNPNSQINFWPYELKLSRHQNQKISKWF